MIQWDGVAGQVCWFPVSQMKGFLTRERYHYATVFLDHYSDFLFIVFQKSLSGEETMRSKSTFESFVKQHGVSICHYHTDNSIFTNNLFNVNTKSKGQTLSYCGIGAHHQYRWVEKLI